jgi:hypothetical protein
MKHSVVRYTTALGLVPRRKPVTIDTLWGSGATPNTYRREYDWVDRMHPNGAACAAAAPCARSDATADPRPAVAAGRPLNEGAALAVASDGDVRRRSLEKASALLGGPRVRIHLPPAASQQRTMQWLRRGLVGAQLRSRDGKDRRKGASQGPPNISWKYQVPAKNTARVATASRARIGLSRGGWSRRRRSNDRSLRPISNLG